MQPRIITSTMLRQLISAGNAYSKAVSINTDSDRCLDYLLNQLANPEHVRPVKKLDPSKYFRHRVFNPLTQVWSYREVETSTRGLAKPGTKFTKKTSVSYLPKDGVTTFFNPKNNDSICFIFDENKCHLKNGKYVFGALAGTDLRWWIKNSVGHTLHASMSIEKLKKDVEELRSKNIVPKPTESLFGLSLESLTGIFVTKYTSEDCLRAIYVRNVIKKKFNLTVPILIIMPDAGIKDYDETMQLADLQYAYKWKNSRFNENFCRKIFSTLPAATIAALEQDKLEESLPDISGLESIDEDRKFSILSFLNIAELYKLYFITANDNQVNESALNKIVSLIKNNALDDLQEIFEKMKIYGITVDEKVAANATSRQQKYQQLIVNNQAALIKFFHNCYNDETSTRIFYHYSLVNTDLKNHYDFYLRKILLTVNANAINFDNRRQMSKTLTAFQTNIDDSLDFNFKAIEHFNLKDLTWLFNSVGNIEKQAKIYFGECLDFDRRLDTTRWNRYANPIAITPLLHAVLNNIPTTHIQFLASRNSENKISALMLMRRIYHSNPCYLEYGDDLNNVYENSKSPYTALLLALKPEDNYPWNAAEKRLVENYLADQLKKFTSADQVKSFWQQHNDGIYLNYHRHANFDRFFRSKHYMPAGKQRIMALVATKLTELGPATQCKYSKG
jgi:hypothetical protein